MSKGSGDISKGLFETPERRPIRSIGAYIPLSKYYEVTRFIRCPHNMEMVEFCLLDTYRAVSQRRFWAILIDPIKLF